MVNAQISAIYNSQELNRNGCNKIRDRVIDFLTLLWLTVFDTQHQFRQEF